MKGEGKPLKQVVLGQRQFEELKRLVDATDATIESLKVRGHVTKMIDEA